MMRVCAGMGILVALLGLSACGGDGGGSGSTDGPGTGDAGDGDGGDGDGDGDGGDGDGDGDGGDGDGDGDGDVDPPELCPSPVELADVSAPDHVVGSGTPDSCTAAEFMAAATSGGVIVFDCGADPVTITLTETAQLPTDRDTVIDGGDLVTLDGGDAVRLLSWDHPNFRTNENTLTLQRMRFQNARAPASDYTDDPGDGCAWGYKDGEGGALYVRDGTVEIIDCHFENNHAADVGPDTGGGAIYVAASLSTTVVSSSFVNNDGANGGAVGLLQTTAQFYNDHFQGNAALGTGQNRVQSGCPDFNHAEQGGAGGNGGAVANDGTEPTELLFCGVTFSGNTANELGGAVFRTPNGARQDTTFRTCTIADNEAVTGGGGGLYISNSYLTIENSTISGNTTDGLGGGVRTERASEINLVNDTFYGNASTMGLVGALSYNDEGGGVIRNCTFAENTANGGPGLFTAAIRGTTAEIYNTILENNVTMEPYNPMQCWHQPHDTGANNFQWPRKRVGADIDDTACVAGITWASAELGPLQDNGGPTLTVEPAAAMVIGAGQDCPATDQRGEPRPSSGCTAGAVEVSN